MYHPQWQDTFSVDNSLACRCDETLKNMFCSYSWIFHFSCEGNERGGCDDDDGDGTEERGAFHVKIMSQAIINWMLFKLECVKKRCFCMYTHETGAIRKMGGGKILKIMDNDAFITGSFRAWEIKFIFTFFIAYSSPPAGRCTWINLCLGNRRCRDGRKKDRKEESSSPPKWAFKPRPLHNLTQCRKIDTLNLEFYGYGAGDGSKVMRTYYVAQVISIAWSQWQQASVKHFVSNCIAS